MRASFCSSRSLGFTFFVFFLLTFVSGSGFGQERVAAAQRLPLITTAVDETRLTVLRGNTHPLARPEFDLGTAPATLPMQRMLLVLKRSSEQESALRKLLDDQQDKNSPNYRKWLTPEEFGQKFGPTDADLQTITGWLQSHGFQVGTTKGRNVLEFSGSASQVQQAFHTTIHKYIVNGELHWANSSDPSMPTALTPAVAGVFTLHNFYKKPSLHWSKQAVPAKYVPGKSPQVTFTQKGQVIHALSPQDYKVIYNMNSLSVSGNSSIGVVGRSNLYNGGQDISNFESVFGGGASFSVLVDGPDPGDLGGGEEAEATLDSTWSAALAPAATVTLVVSASTDTTDGVDLSELYIVEHSLAAVMTESFSGCELYASDAQLQGANALAEQAAAEGITYVVSTGDDGIAGCDDPNIAPARNPISVNFLASTAFNVAVGGTMFNENGHDSTYWSSAAPIAPTALSYIPEDVWNESSLSNGLWASSGGASAGNVAAGGTTAGVPKPNWQAGVTGIPQDGVRDLPDVSLTAASHDPYLLCLEGSCQPDSQGYISVYFISGTSAAAPSFAAIMAFVNDENSRTTGNLRVGLANYVLYQLAAKQAIYPAQCDGSSTTTPVNSDCIFNDIAVGNNVVPGESGTNYQAGPGYDLATGLGSVNVGNLVSQWNSVNFSPTTTALSITTPTGGVVHGSPVQFSVTVTPNSSSNLVPSGDVVLYAQPNAQGILPNLVGPFKLDSTGTFSGTTEALVGGDYSVAAGYSGDANFAPSTSASSPPISITPESSTILVSVLTVDPSGNYVPFTGGPFGSFVYLEAAVMGQSGQGYASGTLNFGDTFGPIPGGGLCFLNARGRAATPNGIFNFDTGTHTISASYTGDYSFNSSTSTQNPSFTITPGFYASIAASQSSVVISAPGGTGQSSLTVANSTGFKGTITLACSGLPSEAKCEFAPASVAANGTPTMTNVAISVTTTAATAMNHSVWRGYFAALWMSAMALTFSGVLLCRKGPVPRGLFLLTTLGLLLFVPACGGGGGGGASHGPPPNAGTPKGVSNVVVIATSGGTTSTTGFALFIQ